MTPKNVPTSSVEQPPAYIPADRGEIIGVILTGALVGIAIGLLTEAIARWFIEPVFCRSTDSFAICANGGNVAFYAATVIVTILSVIALVRIGVFRPLLVAVASAASLWGIKSYIDDFPWYEYGLWLALLFALTYLMFYWLLRARSFVLSLIIALIGVVAIRWLLIL
jgi:hypothetical protein